jgi:predicted Rossmann fold nucleotide-binding protein DprA/Smf involved in DNA uptake
VLLELAGTMTLVRDHVIAQTPPVPVAPPRSSIRSLRVIDFLSEAWSSLDAIARDMALPKTTVYRKLYYLRQRGQVEASGDKWRRKKPGLRLVEASPE